MKAMSQHVLQYRSSKSSSQSMGKDVMLLGELIDVKLDLVFNERARA